MSEKDLLSEILSTLHNLTNEVQATKKKTDDEENLQPILFNNFVEEYYCVQFVKRPNGEKKLKKERIRILNRIQKFFDNIYLHEITIQHIHDWLIHIEINSKSKKLQPITLLRYCDVLKKILNLAIKFKFLTKNVVVEYNFKAKENVSNRVLNYEEIEMLIEYALKSRNDELILAIYIALNTGLRRNEIFQLRKHDITTSDNIVYIKVRAENSKSNKDRVVPINRNIQNMIFEYIKDLNENDKLFKSECRSAFNTCVKKVKRVYDTEHFRFHDLRHTFATNIVQKGGNIYNIKTILGHSCMRMTERYFHYDVNNLVSTVKLLDS